MNNAPESHLKVSICLMSPYLLNGLRICGNNLMVTRITVGSDKRTMKLFFYSAELKKQSKSFFVRSSCKTDQMFCCLKSHRGGRKGGGDFEEGVPTLVMLPALAFEVQLKTRARHRCRHPSCRCCCCSCSDVINRLRRETLFPGLVIKRHFLWQIHSNQLKTNLWFILRRHIAVNFD